MELLLDVPLCAGTVRYVMRHPCFQNAAFELFSWSYGGMWLNRSLGSGEARFRFVGFVR
jgi:hypothetical protein